MKVGLFIVGAPKSGTTSLYHYLKEHPEIYMSKEKELDFFSHEELGELITYYKSNPITSHKDYLLQFEGVTNEKILGEGSVSYLFYPETPCKISKYNPNAKIIIMLRNPIYRAFSHYLMDYKLGLVNIPFEQVLNQKHKIYYQQFIEIGFYYQQVKRYLDVFGQENVHIIKYGDFKNHTFNEVRKVFDFLNINSTYSPNVIIHNKFMMPKQSWVRKFYSLVWARRMLSFLLPNKVIETLKDFLFKQGKPKLSDDLKNELLQLYNEDIGLLEGLLNMDLRRWKK